MLGNLSKVLINTPSFFEYNEQDYLQNKLNKIPEENESNIFNSINIKTNRGKSINSIYFREKDFWKKNYEQELNFNHNKKLLFKLNISSEKPLKSENNSIDLNKIKNYNTINNERRKYSYISINSPKSTNGKSKNNDNIYINSLLKSAKNLTESNKIFDNNKLLNDIKINNNISNNINISDEEKETQVNKNNNKFPKIKINFRSPESLFQEKADKKFTSLISVKPQIKEQLKEKNRCIVGFREFLMFQKSKNMNVYNPFYESMKMKEEMYNIRFKKKNI